MRKVGRHTKQAVEAMRHVAQSNVPLDTDSQTCVAKSDIVSQTCVAKSDTVSKPRLMQLAIASQTRVTPQSTLSMPDLKTPTILFVCRGNICRSVSGEYLLRYFAEQYGKRVSNGQKQSRSQAAPSFQPQGAQPQGVQPQGVQHQVVQHQAVRTQVTQQNHDQSDTEQLDCIIRSCGLLRHMQGSPAESTISQLLQQHGIDASDSRSQFVQAKDLQEATIVLCFSQRQVSELVDIEPRAARKIFIIDEFAALCQAAVEQGYVRTSDSQGMAVSLESTGHVQTLDMSGDCSQRLQSLLEAVPMLLPYVGQAHGVEDPFGKEYDVFVQAVNQIGQYVQTIATALFA